MNNISGLPAHPLLVHIPVALLPLAAVGVVFLIARQVWYERYRWAVLGIGAIGTGGAFLATASGESLETQLRARDGIDAVRAVHDHAEAGDMARNLAVLFFVALAAYVVVPWYLQRRSEATTEAHQRPDEHAASTAGPGWLRPVLTVAVTVTALASMVTIVGAGHSGASRAWEEYDTSVASPD